jgi:ElaB/YqjD/DUF883 family membrane-anchored ribosome-binding protein
MSEHTSHEEREPSGGVAEQAHEIAEQAQEAVAEAAGTQKHALADHVGALAHALSTAAEELSEGQRAMLARTLQSGADRLRQLADSIHDKELGQILAEVEDYGRRQPIAVLGAAAAAGFLLSRVAKSATAPPDDGATRARPSEANRDIVTPQEAAAPAERELYVPSPAAVRPEEER